MTGFARVGGSNAHWRWAWEARSVNGRGLDLRLRLPTGFDRLDQPARALASKRFQRGSISLNLALTPVAAEGEVRINRARLDGYVALAKELASQHGFAPARSDGMLALRGVIEVAEGEDVEDPAAVAALDAALLAALEATLDGLSRARADRLAQEAALLANPRRCARGARPAARACAQARALTARPLPVGRKLDFLAQEFNREANTLCSKSADVELTRIGLELKADRPVARAGPERRVSDE
jgi:uncharacterized protein YicC (UPF0701 family)